MVTDNVNSLLSAELPAGWELLPLGDCVKEKLSYGINAPAVPYSSKLPRYIRITDIMDDGNYSNDDVKSVSVKDYERYLLSDGDIVIARTGASVGKAYLYNKKDGKLAYAGFLIKAAVDVEKFNPKYIYSFFHTNKFWQWVSVTSMRSGQPGINGKEYASLRLPIAPKEEQDEIGKVLSAFDTYITNLTELIEKKKNIRDGALEDLVTGTTRLKGFDGEWKSVSFNQVITPKARIGWQGLKKHEYLKRGYSYLIGGTDFKDGSINLSSVSYVTKDRYDMDANIQVGENDVLVTKDGTIGKVAIVPQLAQPATLNSGVFVFRTNKALSPKFLYRVLSSSVFKTFIELLSAGSTIKHLYQKDLKNFEFMMPVDIKEQEAIASVLTAMDEEILNLEAERDKMIAIRDGAMDDLLTGRVRLK